MPIHRTPPEKGGYTRVQNRILEDCRLSLRAKGLLCKMLSLPDTWNFSEKGLVAISPKEGRTAIKTALNELEAAGYVRKEKQPHGERGKFAKMIYHIYDTPQPAGAAHEAIEQPGEPTEIPEQPEPAGTYHSHYRQVEAAPEPPIQPEILPQTDSDPDLQELEAQMNARIEAAIKKSEAAPEPHQSGIEPEPERNQVGTEPEPEKTAKSEDKQKQKEEKMNALRRTMSPEQLQRYL